MKNIFHTFTRKCLKENRTRTLVTIIGIILSMTLFTAVIEGAYSGMQYLSRCIKAEEGAWEGVLYNLDAETISRFAEDKEVEGYTEVGRVGWAVIQSEETYAPYLLVESLNEGYEDYLSLHLTRGRMPENSSEIVVQEYLALFTDWKIGDEITLECGRRTFDGRELHTEEAYGVAETLTDMVTKTYTITGFTNRLTGALESFSCPGYMAFTFGAQTEKASCYYTLKHPTAGRTYIEEQRYTTDTNLHGDLLDTYGVTSASGVNFVISGFAAVLVVLIVFGSVSLIYNSFSISLSERKRLIGILKSVGATRKQIRSCVLYEALLLSGIGIPVGCVIGCSAIGIVLYCLRDSFSMIFAATYPSGEPVVMKMVLHPLALVISAAICLVTTLLSAWVPAKAVEKTPPIEAIRQSSDMQIKDKEVKTSPLTLKLFGLPGLLAAKNFRRNSKRYRSVVISLFVSILLFVSVSSFTSYLRTLTGVINAEDSKVDIAYFTVGEKNQEETIMRLLSGVEGVTDSTYYRGSQYVFTVPMTLLDDRYATASFGEGYQGETGFASAYITFLEDGDFRTLCRENGLDAEKYFNTDNPCGLLYNHINAPMPNGRGDRWLSADVFRTDNLPLSLKAESVTYDENGQELSRTEMTFVLADTIKKTDPFQGTDICRIYYPYSMFDAVFGSEAEAFDFGLSEVVNYSFKTDNHYLVFEKMKEALAEKDIDTTRLQDFAKEKEQTRMIITVIDVFAFCFIILISLISAANAFNTISTNVGQRRREFAMLRSIGLDRKAFRKMMNYECLAYGFKSLVFGLPASIGVTFILYLIIGAAAEMRFYIPVYSIILSVVSIFVVVFLSMWYASARIRKDNLMDDLKEENF